MPAETRSWLPVGLALGMTVVLAAFVAATCAWRAPARRRIPTVAASPPTASIAEPGPPAAGRPRGRGEAAAAPAVSTPPAVSTAHAAQAEDTGGDEREQTLGRSAALEVPWARPGMCPGGRDDRRMEARAAYLATFVPLPAWHTTFYAHPTVPREVAIRVASSVESIHAAATDHIGLPSEPPPIYLYPSVDVLREHSCAAASALAYYDGAIHLAITEPASNAELEVSLRHEYAHHVLVSNGVGKPIWFQEGTAMHFAGDTPHDAYRIWREHPIQLSAMVEAFPTPGSPETATVFNAQAVEMATFLLRLCHQRSNCNPAQLARALVSGSATPATLFLWATADRGSDLIETTPLQLWDDYERLGAFSPETRATLLGRGAHAVRD